MFPQESVNGPTFIRFLTIKNLYCMSESKVKSVSAMGGPQGFFSGRTRANTIHLLIKRYDLYANTQCSLEKMTMPTPLFYICQIQSCKQIFPHPFFFQKKLIQAFFRRKKSISGEFYLHDQIWQTKNRGQAQLVFFHKGIGS